MMHQTPTGFSDPASPGLFGPIPVDGATVAVPSRKTQREHNASTLISTAGSPEGQSPRRPEPRSEEARFDVADRRFWNDFYRKYDPLVRRIVASRRLSTADADDCVQEIWTEIVATLPKLRYDPRRGPLEAVLYTLARRKIWSFLRRQSRSCIRLAESAASVADSQPNPSAACLRSEKRELVRRTLEAMRADVSDKNYRVLCLRWMDGRGAAEIARAVDLKPRQVRYRLARMKPRLRALLSRHLSESDLRDSF